MIVIADGDTAGTQDEVAFGDGAAVRLFDDVAPVGGRRIDPGDGAGGVDEGFEHVGVAVDDLARAGVFAEFDEFVSGAEDGDPGPGIGGGRRLSEAGEESDGGGAESAADLQGRLAGFEVGGGAPDIGSLSAFWTFVDGDPVIRRLTEFATDDGVGAVGEGGARRDADRLPGVDGRLRWGSGGGFTDDVERHRRVVEVAEAQCETIHRRVVEPRGVPGGNNGFSEMTAPEVGELNPGGACRRDPSQDVIDGVVDVDVGRHGSPVSGWGDTGWGLTDATCRRVVGCSLTVGIVEGSHLRWRLVPSRSATGIVGQLVSFDVVGRTRLFDVGFVVGRLRRRTPDEEHQPGTDGDEPGDSSPSRRSAVGPTIGCYSS